MYSESIQGTKTSGTICSEDVKKDYYDMKGIVIT